MNQNWSYSPKTPNLGQNWQFLSHVTLQFDRWPWKTQTGVTVPKLLNWVLTSVTLTSDLDLLHGHHFRHWKSLLQISWWHHNGNIMKKVWHTDRQTDGWTDRWMDRGVLRAAWLQLKNIVYFLYDIQGIYRFQFANEFKSGLNMQKIMRLKSFLPFSK